MSTDRKSALFFEALASVFFTLAAGFCFDIGFKATGFACSVIVICLLIALLCTWLGPNPDINDRG